MVNNEMILAYAQAHLKSVLKSLQVYVPDTPELIKSVERDIETLQGWTFTDADPTVVDQVCEKVRDR